MTMTSLELLHNLPVLLYEKASILYFTDNQNYSVTNDRKSKKAKKCYMVGYLEREEFKMVWELSEQYAES